MTPAPTSSQVSANERSRQGQAEMVVAGRLIRQALLCNEIQSTPDWGPSGRRFKSRQHDNCQPGNSETWVTNADAVSGTLRRLPLENLWGATDGSNAAPGLHKGLPIGLKMLPAVGLSRAAVKQTRRQLKQMKRVADALHPMVGLRVDIGSTASRCPDRNAVGVRRQARSLHRGRGIARVARRK